VSYDPKANANARGIFPGQPPVLRTPSFCFDLDERRVTALTPGTVLADIRIPADFALRKVWVNHNYGAGSPAPNFNATGVFLLNQQEVGRFPYLSRRSGTAQSSVLPTWSSTTGNGFRGGILVQHRDLSAFIFVVPFECFVAADRFRLVVDTGVIGGVPFVDVISAIYSDNSRP
jgi:hypothetical protein